MLKKLLLLKTCSLENFSKVNKRAGWNKAVQVGIFQKIIDFATCLLNIQWSVYLKSRLSLDLKSGFNHLNSFLNYFKHLCIHI